MSSFHEKYRVPVKRNFRLSGVDADDTGPFKSKKEGKKFVHDCIRKIHHLQFRLFVERRQSLLIVLQAPDAAGKDGLIRKVLGQMNPQGCRVFPFKVPTELESQHDFLWRVHACVPAAGQVVIFNRSHYEDVLVARVENLVDQRTWKSRYQQINAFESLLASAGTRVLKLYLHISPGEQLERFKERLDNPEKHWKLNPADYQARSQIDDYHAAYEEVFARCNPKQAPWYVIPANHKWFRNCAAAAIVLDALQSLDPQLPPIEADLDEIRRLYDKEKAEQSDSDA
jgi:PPK2 family polyphosphate:nucleotide phosphotransferase